MSPLPPSPFLSVDGSPPSSTGKPAVAHLPGKGSATAEAIKVSDGDSVSPLPSGESDPSVMLGWAPSEPAVTGLGRAVTAGLSHNPITQAVEVQPSPRGSGSASRDIAHLIRHAGQPSLRSGSASRLNRPRFAPDFHAMWEAMHDPDAPRAPRPSLDPVWDDASPTFLQMVRS